MTRPVPPSQVAWRPAPERRPIGGGRNPYFVLWYSYLSFYTEWIDDTALSGVADSPVGSRPLPPEGLPTGGLQLDVEPRRSQVYVDGAYAGPVDDFRGYYHHLDLPAGPHRVDLLLPGYPLQTLDVVVTPGRTTTYRGTLGAVMRVD